MAKHRAGLNETQQKLRRASDLMSKNAKSCVKEFCPDNQSQFVPRNVEKIIVPHVSAKRSQSDANYKFAPSCFGNALMAVCYPKDASRWRESDMNRILDMGYLKYEFMRTRSNKPKNDHLGVDDAKPLQQQIKIERFLTRFSIKEPCITGTVVYEEDEFQFFCGLETAINRVFRDHQRALLLAEQKWFSIIKSEETIYVFNSHSVDDSNQPCSGGKARLFECNNVDEAILILTASFSGGDMAQFQIFGVDVNVFEA